MLKTVRPISSNTSSAQGIAVGGDRDTELAEEGARHIEEEIEVAVARNPRAARVPVAPTKAMRMAHEVHHADYRAWCPVMCLCSVVFASWLLVADC